MIAEVEEYDWDAEEWIYNPVLATGMPLASADLSIIAIWNDTPSDMSYAQGFIFDLTEYASIDDVIEAGIAKVSIDEDGNLQIEGELTAIEVYDLKGIRIVSVENPGTSVNCALAKGIYIVKGHTPQGAAFTAKIAH
ncbi:MAG: hypothetical protein NC336_00515 [Clostridium sp.]|nr:hypothetical protein [Clostridium sp.]